MGGPAACMWIHRSLLVTGQHPKFSVTEDALQFVLHENRVYRIIHYLDNFVLFGAPGTPQCGQALQLVMDWYNRLGVPIAESKTEGPAETIIFLEIELDTLKGELQFPEEKRRRLQREIRQWTDRRSCTKRELLSLIGQLQHACCVVHPGRTFLRIMIFKNFSTKEKRLHHNIRLNIGMIGMMAGIVRSAVTAILTSDASGSWGCGVYTSTGEWFMLQWPYS